MKAEAKLLLGFSFNYQGDYKKAVEQYELGRLIADPVKDVRILARLNNNLANELITFGEYSRALELAIQAKEGFKSLNDQYFVGRTNILIPVIYSYMGEDEKGEHYLLDAYKIAQALNNNTLLRDSYYYLSEHYKEENNFSKAITFAEMGLQLAEKMNNDQYTVMYFEILGALYLNIGEIDKAVGFYNRAFNYYETVGNATLANKTILHIVRCFKALNDLEEAERLLFQALEFYEDSEYKYNLGETLIALGDLELRKKNDKAAFKYLKRAIDIGKSNDLFWIQYWGQKNLIKMDDTIVSKQEKISLSRKLYSYSIKISPENQLEALQLLSSSFARINSDSAFFYSDKVLDLIEKKRLSFSGGNLKAALFSDEAPYYNEVGSWYASLKKDYSKAFELIEASKARALLDQLAINQEGANFSINESDRIRLLEAQKKVDLLYRSKETATNEEEIYEITQEVIDAELIYDATIERISSRNNTLNNFLYPKTLSLTEVQELTDSKTAIIEYAFTDNKLLIFTITEKEILFNEQLIEKEFIKEKISEFREAIISEANITELELFSDILYSYLMEPFYNKLDGIENLVIIPDGPISYLPFEALIVNNSYLVQTLTIKYLPSASVFNYIQNPHRKTSGSLLALAGSGFIEGDIVNPSSNQPSFATLPYTLIEVDSIAKNFKKSTILKNDDLTEVALKSLDLGIFKFIHFATHGDINEVSPSQSGLLLSKKKETEILFGEDGYLNAIEIGGLRLNADMVVLSACNTGMGKVLSGEGVMGLQRSFLVAGASSVVASLWSIYDRSTPLFMRYFYANLVEYEEEKTTLIDQLLIWANWYEPKLVDYKALALRDAKLQMIDHPYYSHPVHWAPFVITGK